MTEDARTAMLSAIRQAKGSESALSQAALEYAALDRHYTSASDATTGELLELLTARLLEYDSFVYRAAPGQVAATVAAILAARGNPRILIDKAFPPAWLLPDPSALVDRAFSNRELDGFDGVLTGATCAIAETGTLVLQHGPGQGRRAITLVPDYHLCLVEASTVVATVPQAVKLLSATCTLPTTFISGPSATADIEMTRIKGVHGPRFLDVILIGDGTLCTVDPAFPKGLP